MAASARANSQTPNTGDEENNVQQNEQQSGKKKVKGSTAPVSSATLSAAVLSGATTGTKGNPVPASTARIAVKDTKRVHFSDPLEERKGIPPIRRSWGLGGLLARGARAIAGAVAMTSQNHVPSLAPVAEQLIQPVVNDRF